MKDILVKIIEKVGDFWIMLVNKLTDFKTLVVLAFIAGVLNIDQIHALMKSFSVLCK